MGARTVSVKTSILAANAERAAKIREILDTRQIRMINLMSSPGSGKTSLILETIRRLRRKRRIAVIEGDVASSIDADAIARQGIPAIQINTGGGCHLDAPMMRRALDRLDLEQLDLVFVENVGNLVCTADFDLGAHKNAVILSVPEGDDKARKYPIIFAGADVVVVNKIDVMHCFDFKLEHFIETIRGLNPEAAILPLSARSGAGVDEWVAWVEQSLA